RRRSRARSAPGGGDESAYLGDLHGSGAVILQATHLALGEVADLVEPGLLGRHRCELSLAVGASAPFLDRGRLDERVHGVVVMHLDRLDPTVPVPVPEGALVDPLQE